MRHLGPRRAIAEAHLLNLGYVGLVAGVDMKSAGKRLSQYRKAARLTQEALADQIGVDRTTIGRWERGTSAPRLYQHAPLANALNVPISELQFAPNPDDLRDGLRPNRAALGWTDNQEFQELLADERKTPLVGVDHLDLIEHAIGQIERKDAESGAGGLLRGARALHSKVDSWIYEGSYPLRLANRLQQLSGELGAWCGWLTTDAGSVEQALQRFHQTLLRARVNENSALEVRCMTYLGAFSSAIRPAELLHISQAAQRISAKWATPKLRSLLHLRAACAYADMKDGRSAKEELAKARAELDRGEHEDDPDYLRFLTHGEIAGLAGLSFLELDDPKRASSEFRKILEDPDPIYQRNVAYYTGYLAEALYLEGDTRSAAEVGTQAVHLSRDIASVRTRETLRKLRDSLIAEAKRPPEVSEFVQAYGGVLN